jgi:2-iminobutanoate/2-iminopropanoate deaminase
MVPQPVTVDALPPNNPTYSQAVRLGNLIFVSGQLGIGSSRGLAPGGIRAQTRQALENIGVILRAAGSDFPQVAKVNIFLTDFSLLPAMNAVYQEYFPHRPAKTTVEIARLDQDALIEIEVVASA